MQGRLTLLGTGASTGIPVVGCDCAVCRSADPKNHRLRTAALLQVDGKEILIDVGPDFRTQALQYGIKRLDGVIVTHAHYDHVGGLDELRIFNFRQRQPIPLLLSEATLEDLRRRYYYLFEDRIDGQSYIAQFDYTVLPESGSVQFLDLEIPFVTYFQGEMPVNGFRFGDLALISDIRNYDETIFGALEGVRTLVVSALRQSPSHVHFSVDEAVAFSEKVGAEQTWLVHMAHDLEHAETNAHLPSNVQLSYDGLSLDFGK
jgi:phosphoribosyl 1,2-cyclic phosphate phosphodiesterase